nr:immunoglobulin light chain junction region [Macaca mulatta]MPN91435.1 immunoglobulin light chain junction region [Macaca mulatta]MPN91827.1 immunoglobulin light chain junction region [Macaca mulatta]MPN92089.1 immunoglobulin light chain junction region [Macaca mulatta]MPN92754.1 immunoglobulin light chain junction region [Macaca mulatta]
CQQGYSNPYSF